MSIASTQAVRIVPRGNAPLGKSQQRFNRLMKKAAQLKGALASWTTSHAVIYRGIAEHERLRREHQTALIELVCVLDRAFASERSFAKRQRMLLRDLICDLARGVLDDMEPPGHPEVKAIYNRYTHGDYDAELAEARTQQTRAATAMVEDELGLDFDGEEIGSVEELAARARAKLDERAQEEARAREQAEARRARRKKTPRQVETAAKAEAERAQVAKSLQEIYRKLARALHPDHEPDAAERARKTLLMQQVNVAYEAKDLLQLLELQLRFEHVDQAHINMLAEDRLRHFNQLLAEQVRELEREVAQAEAPWRHQLGIDDGRKLPPERVLIELRRDLRIVTADIAMVRRDVTAFADVRALKVWLDAMRPVAPRRSSTTPW